MSAPQLLEKKHRKLAGDFAEGALAMFVGLKRKLGEPAPVCPYNDSNFDRPRRDAWHHGHDWAASHREEAAQFLFFLTGRWWN